MTPDAGPAPLHALSNLVVVVALAVVGGCSSDEESRRERCERVRNHIVDLRLTDLPSTDVSPETRDAHRSALTQALGDDFITTCELHYEDRGIACALAAQDVATATHCGEP